MGLNLGSLTVDPPVVLAPMAGITNPAFRTLCRQHGARGRVAGAPGIPGLYVSEMVTARALVEGNAKTKRMVTFAPDESPRSVQLYGVDPVTIGEAVRRLIGDHGVDHVDLNFGCPVAKVTRKGGGAALPLHHALLRRIVEAAVRAATLDGVPLTIKFRMGVDADHRTDIATGRIAQDEGAAAVALHARTAEQGYAGVADWDAIAALKESLCIPVLGNGDIWDGDDALAMMAKTGCDGVVVGRGCLGRPWLFRDLVDAFAGRPPQPAPALGEVVAVMRQHARLLVEHLGEGNGVPDFRKHISWYLLGYPAGARIRQRLPAAQTLAELEALLDQLDPSLRLVDGRAPSPRGATYGPRRVVLPAGWLATLDDPNPPEGAELLVSGG
jgi:nifR3 family TIM-barrel protein